MNELIIALVVAAVAGLAFLALRLLSAEKLTLQTALAALWANDEVVRTQPGSTSGSFESGEIHFDAAKPKRMDGKLRRFLHAELGDKFSLKYSGYIDLGLAMPPSITAYVKSEKGDRAIEIA